MKMRKYLLIVLLISISSLLMANSVTSKVSPPVASVPSGTYDVAQRVILSSETQGATIYYTIDGSNPLTSSTRAIPSSRGIQIQTTCLLKAVAVKEGIEPSDIVSYQYFIKVSDPKPNLEDGEWKELPNEIILSSSTPDAIIYYTTDGSSPTKQSSKYSKPIKLEKGKTNVIKAIAIKEDGSPESNVVTLIYEENPNLILLTDVLRPDANEIYVINKVISEMTLDEKVRMVWGAATSQLGAAGNTYAIPRLGITSMELADGPAGLRLGGFGSGGREATAWPNPMMLASTWNTEILEKIGTAIADEAKFYGIDIMLGPGMNIHRDPLGGRVFEYYSEDPYITGKMAAAWIDGLQDNGVGATMKHYAANNSENNRMNINVIVSERALREIYLTGFEIATKESNPWAAMSAYNKINGTFGFEHEYLSKMLRDVFGFKGLIMSDWGGYHNPISFKNGFDLNEPGGSGSDNLKDAINNGIITEKDLDRAISNILNVVIKTETFKHQIYDKSEFAANQKIPSSIATIHADISKEAALEGIVLLKNDDTLPLQNVSSVALIGGLAYKSELPSFWGSPAKGLYYEGGGSAAVVVDPEEVVTLQEAFSSGGLNVLTQTEKGEYLKEGMSKNDAIYAAKNSDVGIILIGRPGTEGADNTPESMKLTAEEFALIRNVSEAYHSLGKKVIVLLNVAHPIETDDWDNYVDSILYIGLPGTYGASAVTDILLGNVNPSGKLVDTWPIKYEYAPTYGNMPQSNQAEITYSEDIYVGYRYYDMHPEYIKYPFGYGLSYTKFKYESIALNKSVFNLSNENETVEVKVKVKNIGQVTGKEIVQLYVKANESNVERPYKELQGFAKTELLKPGETQEITFTLDARAFAYFDEIVHDWIVEPGTYTIIVGGTSDNEILNKAGVKGNIFIKR